MARLPKETDYGIEQAEMSSKKETKPTVFLDVPFEQAKNLNAGDSVTIIFTGKIKGLNVRESDEGPSRAHVDMEDPEVRIKAKQGAIAALDEDMDE